MGALDEQFPSSGATVQSRESLNHLASSFTAASGGRLKASAYLPSDAVSSLGDDPVRSVA
jgi:hypothetical protein